MRWFLGDQQSAGDTRGVTRTAGDPAPSLVIPVRHPRSEPIHARLVVLALLAAAAVALSAARAGQEVHRPLARPVVLHRRPRRAGKVIAFDPQVMPEFERKDPVKADFVCVSHPHNDHNRVEEAIADAQGRRRR